MPNAVLLWGKILLERDARILLDVEPRMGDAAIFGLGGQIWFARRECVEVHEAAVAREYDFIRVPEQVARVKAQAMGNVQFNRGRKPR